MNYFWMGTIALAISIVGGITVLALSVLLVKFLDKRDKKKMKERS